MASAHSYIRLRTSSRSARAALSIVSLRGSIANDKVCRSSWGDRGVTKEIQVDHHDDDDGWDSLRFLNNNQNIFKNNLRKWCTRCCPYPEFRRQLRRAGSPRTAGRLGVGAKIDLGQLSTGTTYFRDCRKKGARVFSPSKFLPTLDCSLSSSLLSLPDITQLSPVFSGDRQTKADMRAAPTGLGNSTSSRHACMHADPLFGITPLERHKPCRHLPLAVAKL